MLSAISEGKDGKSATFGQMQGAARTVVKTYFTVRRRPPGAP